MWWINKSKKDIKQYIHVYTSKLILKPFSCWKISNPYLDKCNYKSEPYDRVYLIHVLYIVLLTWFWFSKQILILVYGKGRYMQCPVESPFQHSCKVHFLFENKHCCLNHEPLAPWMLVIVALHTYANWIEKTLQECFWKVDNSFTKWSSMVADVHKKWNSLQKATHLDTESCNLSLN